MLGTGREEFQKAAADLMATADGGDIAEARKSVTMAAFLIGFQLDLPKERKAAAGIKSRQGLALGLKT